MMGWRKGLILLSLGVFSSTVAAMFVASPGYMDAEYYFATGRELATGRGFVEALRWNFLDGGLSLPHPSHLYWMPGASVLAATGMRLFGDSFRAAQVPAYVLTALLPLLTAWMAFHIVGDREKAFLAGMLSAFPGFYLPYFLTTDTFILYTWLGGLTLLALMRALQSPTLGRWMLVGMLAGACHLTRADGLVLLALGLAGSLSSRRYRWMDVGVVAGGYALAMLPWWLRNLSVVGSAMPGGLTRTLWLLDYDDLFIYPASLLTYSRWAGSGVQQIAHVRWQALLTNLQSLLVVNGLIFLGPLMAVGGWKLRSHPSSRTSAAYLATLLFLMSIIFPFAGARGGWFHSSAAAMPFLWSFASLGLGAVVSTWARRRDWELPKAERGFGLVAVLLAAFVTAIVLGSRVVGLPGGEARWQASQQRHAQLAQVFPVLVASSAPIAANDAPGMHLATGAPTVSIPDGGAEMLRQAAVDFGVGWVVLEFDHPKGLADLYRDPGSVEWLELAGRTEVSGHPAYLFQVTLPGDGS
jgi:hypothetical protein